MSLFVKAILERWSGS